MLSSASVAARCRERMATRGLVEASHKVLGVLYTHLGASHSALELEQLCVATSLWHMDWHRADGQGLTRCPSRSRIRHLV